MKTLSDPSSGAVIEPRCVSDLRPYRGNTRMHSKKQIREIADSITRCGFTNPILISDDNEIIAGHGRVRAARLFGMESAPPLRLSHLNAAQRRVARNIPQELKMR
jgi:ParB-like chromosome segregation protein Spo0J